MQPEEIIRQLILEGKSLTRSEREKAAGPFDEIYIQERIQRHVRRLSLCRLVVVLLYADVAVALFTLFADDWLQPITHNWLMGTMAVVFVVCVLCLPFLLINHGRNASILRMIRHIRSNQ